MPTLNAFQHVFSSVARGYFPQQGRGFQTVAVAEELIGTEDLRALEDAAFYAVSRERRRVSDFPVKETFFRLPSGRFAIGRTVNWGTDSLGREGNYLAQHLVLDRADLLAAEAHPLAVLDAARLAEKMAAGRAEPGIDLTPRTLPPLEFEVATATADFSGFAGINAEWLANLATAVVEGGERTALVIGDEARARGVLRGLLASLAREERLRLTFSTHCYEAHHLRPLFALVTVRSRAEASAQMGRREEYHVFDLDDGEFPRLEPVSAYAGWLAECLRARRWQETVALNAVLDELRDERNERVQMALPVDARAGAALWERAGVKVARALVGDAALTADFLRQLPARRELADALLAAGSPTELCGAAATAEAVKGCLAELRSAATGRVWRAWVKRWQGDAALASFTPEPASWWQRWRLFGIGW